MKKIIKLFLIIIIVFLICGCKNIKLNSINLVKQIKTTISDNDIDSSKKTVSITFLSNGGNGTMEIQKYKLNEKKPLSANKFSRNGYTFKNWNTEKDGSGRTFNDKQEIAPHYNYTLYAQWTKNQTTPEKTTVTITFLSNGGNGTMDSQIYKIGESKNLSPNIFKKDNYTFIGWNTEKDGSGRTFNDKQEIAPHYDYTLYAQWKLNTSPSNTKITIVFKSNGGTGTMDSQIYKIGESKKLSPNIFKKDNYTFTGWNTEKDGSGRTFNDKQEIKPTKNYTLYAQWKKDTKTTQNNKKITTATINYYANNKDTTEKMNEQKCTIKKKCALSKNKFTRKGYKFKNWNTKSNGKGKTYKDTDKIIISSNIKLYAQWEKITTTQPKTKVTKTSKNEYTIVYNCNCSNCKGETKSQTIKNKSLFVPKVNNYTCDGYEFNGWNSKKDGSGNDWTYKIGNIDFSKTKNNTKTLYAMWTPKSPYNGNAIKPSNDYKNLGECKNLIKIEKVYSQLSPNPKIKTTGTVDYLLSTNNRDNKNGVYCSYESSTLKYYVTQNNNNYMITYIWTNDPYNQFKMGLPYDKNTKKFKKMYGEKIMNNEVANRNLKSKGLVGINATPMFQSEFNFGNKKAWDGQPNINLIRVDGETIKDNLDYNYKRDDVILYGLTKNGNLRYFKSKFDSDWKSNKCKTKECIEGHKLVRKYIESNNYDIQNVFGWYPVLVENNKIVINPKSNSNNKKSIRQGICQIDANNFVFITSTTHDSSTDTRKSKGLSRLDVAKIMKNIGCKTGFNIDGGGSVSYFYKSNNDDLVGPLDTHQDSRLSSGVIYFVEK